MPIPDGWVDSLRPSSAPPRPPKGRAWSTSRRPQPPDRVALHPDERDGAELAQQREQAPEIGLVSSTRKPSQLGFGHVVGGRDRGDSQGAPHGDAEISAARNSRSSRPSPSAGAADRKPAHGVGERRQRVQRGCL